MTVLITLHFLIEVEYLGLFCSSAHHILLFSSYLLLIMSLCSHFFNLLEHGQAKGDESFEAEENVSNFYFLKLVFIFLNM